MTSPQELGFLQSIGETPDDDSSRLVFSDWLDDHGEEDRAEFIRTQCELARDDLDDERRRSLTARERQLLSAHRQEWIDALGVPTDDVTFRKGLVDSVHVSEWGGAKTLDVINSGRLATVTELDLSGLALDLAEVAAFANAEPFPSLRKLILSDNKIGNPGIRALAKSHTFPRLDVLYLFDNPIDGEVEYILDESPTLRLGHLDIGQVEEGYCMSAGQTEMARKKYIREKLMPIVSKFFADYELLQSAMLVVAQYWCDEAHDAVHSELIVSELPDPVLEGVDDWPPDTGYTDPNLPTTVLKDRHSSAIELWDYRTGWHDNSGAIPVWAAYADEGGHQEYGQLADVYSPAVMFYRNRGYSILPMRRPYLDGVTPEWDF